MLSYTENLMLLLNTFINLISKPTPEFYGFKIVKLNQLPVRLKVKSCMAKSFRQVMGLHIMYQFLNKGLIVAKMWKVAICRAGASGQVGQTIA